MRLLHRLIPRRLNATTHLLFFATAPSNGPPNASAVLQDADPPVVTVGPSVDEAYAAIPHRRTVWDESGSSVSPDEKAYLRAVFGALDQAVRVRVAAQQDYANRRYDSADINGEFDRLISFVRGLTVPRTLASYHRDVLNALTNEQRFFAEWKSQGDRFEFAQSVANHPGVRAASASLHAAYDELMSKYPNENPTNKDAFFDYHCALDFL